LQEVVAVEGSQAAFAALKLGDAEKNLGMSTPYKEYRKPLENLFGRKPI